ncbi:UV radiation resistance protein and autophagy-related subunit 14-domain-containing protein [Lipomyces orientalis]|uniref:UV radiation resistance protein and autophagy-related subunit 14-domain-containing protein n=1 Tax=Lipomyces orientalis TaxID=1233043 RepID=A0ACC3TTG3_9ASCO
MKLDKIEKSILDAESHRLKNEQAISTFLLSNGHAFKSLIRAQQERAWLDFQRAALGTEQSRLETSRHRRDELSTKLELRKLELNVARQKWEQGVIALENCKAELDRKKETERAVGLEILEQRRRICEDLEKIYPIDPIVGRTLAFSIRGIELPNTSYDGYDEELLGTALGYTAHLVYLLSFYLGVKLRYPVYPGGSHSYIEDPVSVFQGSRTFPLWVKGSVYYRFEYGVFLLNKSIEQLMNSQSLLVIDLRHTLPNLKCLLLSMESNG